MPKVSFSKFNSEDQPYRNQLIVFGEKVAKYFGNGVTFETSVTKSTIETGTGSIFIYHVELKINGPWERDCFGTRLENVQDAIDQTIEQWKSYLRNQNPGINF